jgi:hypothetical protein
VLTLDGEQISHFFDVLSILDKWDGDIVSAPRFGVDALVYVNDISGSDNVKIKCLSEVRDVGKLEGTIWFHHSVKEYFANNNLLLMLFYF